MRFLLPCVLLASLAVLPAQQPAAVLLGTTIDAPFTDLRWQPRRLSELPQRTATVLFFATIECPIVQRYLPRIGQLSREFQERGVVFVVVNVSPGDRFQDAVGDVVEKAPAAVFARDFDLQLAHACGVDRTGAALVLDAAGKLVYRGRVDDQHGYAGMRSAPSRDDLRLALEDVLAARPVAVAETAISGCKITPPAAGAVAADRPAPTFARDIAPLLQKHCQDCHRDGGEAPFPLLDEAQLKKHAAMVGEVVEQDRMPPWYGSARHGEFANLRRLTDAEKATLRAWLQGGMPSGDAEDLPPPRALPTPGSWRIGEPDLVLAPKGAIKLPADGIVPYQYILLPYRFTQDTWVESIEIRPANERVLHHCNLARVKLGEKFSQEGFITGYVPGGDPLVMDPGTAVRIPAGSALVLQAHYVTIGESAQDQVRVGLRFPRVPVQKEMLVAIASDFRFTIPPGAMAQPVTAGRALKDDAIGIGLFVHMHLRGRDMTVTATPPNGDAETLLVVPNYNFDWQQSYRWAPGQRRFAKGTRIRALAHFDNSKWNPFNPDATTAVRYGEETTDEMMFAFLFWVREHEQLGLVVDARTGHVTKPVEPGR